MTRTYKMPSDEVIEAKAIGLTLTSINAANFLFDELNDFDFFNTKHRIVFTEAKEAYSLNQKLDFDWILHALTRKNLLEQAGGVEYITQLAFYFGQSGEHENYAKHLRNLSRLRMLIATMESGLEATVKNNADAEEVSDELQKKIFECQGISTATLQSASEIHQNFSKIGDFEQTIHWVVNEQRSGRKPYLGIPSGYPILDNVLGYFRPGAIYYIGARTSMGKTTFLLNLIHNFLKNNLKIGFFNMEMKSNLVFNKLTAIIAELPFDDIDEGRLTDSQLAHFIKCGSDLDKKELYIDSQDGLTINQLRSRAKRMKICYGIDILCIDYLTCIKSTIKNATRHIQVDEVSKGLQALSKELDIPIICLAQLNRQVTGRKDFTPTLSDFRESGSIEEDADACILLHRPDYYERELCPGQIQVIVAKNRIRGQLKKIAFARKGAFIKSEAYEELKYLGDEVKTCNYHSKGDADDDEQRI